MTRGSLRADEAWLREYAAKRNRFTTVPDKSGQVDQRPAALEPPALTPPLATGDGGAPIPQYVRYQELGASAQIAPAVAPIADWPTLRKYRNKPTDGYASIRESKRAFQLKLMQEAGQIRNLREQVSFLLIPKQEGERACSYVADFCYDEWVTPGIVSSETGLEYVESRVVVEDCKGMRTDVYRIKRKLMLFVHGIRVRET